MLKTASGHFFLRNDRMLPGGWRWFQESHDVFSFMFSFIFHDLLKLNPREFSQF